MVDSIGNPKKIASAAARISQNPRDLMMAEDVARVIAATPYFKEGFSYQTGVGGASIASTISLTKIMEERQFLGLETSATAIFFRAAPTTWLLSWC